MLVYPFLIEGFAHERQRELLAEARRERLRLLRGSPPTPLAPPPAIRVGTNPQAGSCRQAEKAPCASPVP